MSSVEFSQLTHYLNKFAEQQALMVRMLARLVELAEQAEKREEVAV